MEFLRLLAGSHCELVTGPLLLRPVFPRRVPDGTWWYRPFFAWRSSTWRFRAQKWGAWADKDGMGDQGAAKPAHRWASGEKGQPIMSIPPNGVDLTDSNRREVENVLT